jgi:hypothetical protein
MVRTGAALLAICCLGLLVGCRGEPSVGSMASWAAAQDEAGGPTGPLERVEEGMRAEEVEAVAGEPAAIEQRDGETAVWYYEGGVVIFREGRVRFRYPLPGR